ncbi:nascent polypeptide-associated complex subunit alpha, muscle-specific form-like [Conger conger]|uniref:nascent polypeptide-associated complex subunit alpha, muscle-specific form-like n=1 Tax=Conger conger TaxID=82655 RepID=UPI002A5AB601|nr:nascent polypeptide-associated complex subunit alpha, muscle-specific form-like [Conger conger]
MKPDGVDTAAPMETLGPMEALGAEPVAEGQAPEEQLQPAAPPSQQEEAAQPQQQPEMKTAPPAPKEGNGKPAEPKAKTKGPAKTRPATAGAKTTGTSGPNARPGAAQNRILNGVQKPQANGLAKKTNTTGVAAPEKKKLTTTTAPSKRPVGPAAAPPVRPPAKVADRKPVGATRPATAPSAGTSTTKTSAGPAPANKKAPAAPSNGVKARPKPTAPRPASAAPSKPSTAATTKTDRPTVPKTTRPAGVPPSSRPAPATTAAKAAPAAAKPSSSRAGAAAPSAARSAAVQPTKTAAPAKKDVSRPTTAPARKPVSAPTRPVAAKPSKPEPPKATAAAPRPDAGTKRPAATGRAADTKPSRPKATDAKPPAMAEVKASPRAAAGPRPGLAKMSTPSPRKAAGSGTPLSVKRGSKPTQSVQPLSASGEPAKKTQPPRAAVTAAAVATATIAAAAAVAVVEAERPPPVEPPQRAEPAVEQVEASPCPSVPAGVESAAVVLPAQQPEAPVETPAAIVAPLSPPPSPPPSPAAPVCLLLEPEGPPQVSEGVPCRPVMVEQEEAVEDRRELLVPLAAVAPVSQAGPEEPVSAAAPGSLLPEREEAVEKAEEEVNEDEEEREGSQPVSVSDMSGTQPTEESRPGSESVWRGGAMMSELDSEDVSGSQQGASELSAPAVLEGAESMDLLGDSCLKAASSSSPEVEKLSDIPPNEEEEDDDDEDQVYDMEVGSERAEHPHRVRQEGEEEEEDEDVEMASEGVTESGLESYGNADEDDFAEEDRLDNLNRAAPTLLPTAPPPPALWSQSNPFSQPFSQPPQPASDLLGSPSEPWLADPETPTQSPAQAWLELSTPALLLQAQDPKAALAPPARGMSQSSTLSGTELAAQGSSDTSTPEELREYNSGPEEQQQEEDQLQDQPPQPEAQQDPSVPAERAADEEEQEEEEAETLPADELLGGPATAPESPTSSPSTSGDEASDTEGEMLISEPDAHGIDNIAFDSHPAAQSLPALQEREGEGEDDGDTPQSANSVASYGFDCTTSNSNAHSTTESCGKSPGIFSLENEEQLPEEAKDPSLIKELTLPGGEAQPNPEEQHYMLCVKPGSELPDQNPAQEPLPFIAQDPGDGSDTQPPYYSAICEKTDNVLSGGYDQVRRTGIQQQREEEPAASPSRKKRASPLPCDHVSQPRPPVDLPLRSGNKPPSAQLRRLQQHQQQLLQLQQSREQPRHREEEQRQQERKEGEEQKEEAEPQKRLEEEEQQRQEQQRQLEEEVQQKQLEEEEQQRQLAQQKQLEEEEQQRQEQQKQLEQQRQDLLQLQLHLHQQQQAEEQQRRRQFLQWQQELEQQQRQQQQQQQQQHMAQTTVLLSPSSGLCTIYEAMETSDEEEEGEVEELVKGDGQTCEVRVVEKEEMGEDSLTPAVPDAPDSPIMPVSPQRTQQQRPVPTESPPASPSGDPPRPPLELDWSKKVDIVQQLINETLLLTGEGCPPLLLLPGGGGGTLSPLESSLWPTLLPPLTPPSATVTSVSSFSPEDQGSSPQGEWTVVELETHH